ncbi:hypothetical protein BV22DRAFT_54992 [Leucogyrophana mollusca]|uniref:Uncharacterized protein n=1 Tax=Leucogyrophana mollusca TaxID=85980 RepID=A0ACB8BZ36_9AGAM|nr:hypothetical protein BV22DRAFT_54992 [Leucogyrophana mollusca]
MEWTRRGRAICLSGRILVSSAFTKEGDGFVLSNQLAILMLTIDATCDQSNGNLSTLYAYRHLISQLRVLFISFHLAALERPKKTRRWPSTSYDLNAPPRWPPKTHVSKSYFCHNFMVHPRVADIRGFRSC